MLLHRLCGFLFLLALSTFASAQPLPYDLNVGSTPDVPFIGFLADGNQLLLRDGLDGGHHSWSWNATANTVDLHLFFSGKSETFNGHYTYPRNPSNAFNQWPASVRGGKWRLAIVVKSGLFPTTYYWRQSTGDFLGSEYDYYNTPNLPSQPDTVSQEIPGSVMIMTDWLNVRDGIIDQSFHFAYDRFQNFLHESGVVFTDINFRLNDSSTYNTIYSNRNQMVKPVPTYSWAELLQDVNNGAAIGLLPVYQPYPEPSYLLGRDSLVRGQYGMITAQASGPDWSRLSDTATCYAAYMGTPEQQADPKRGNIQLMANFTISACVLSLPAPSKREVTLEHAYTGPVHKLVQLW